MTRNPFRKRWVVVASLGMSGLHPGSRPLTQELSRHWFRGMAEERIAELEGRYGAMGQAYAPGILSIEALS